MITQNKGEWSELYALVYLLATGKLYAADDKLNIIEKVYFPILRILHDELQKRHIEFLIKGDKVEVELNGTKINVLNADYLAKEANKLYQGILNGASEASFSIDSAETLMQDLSLTKVKASTGNKSDIIMEIHDIQTGIDNICGFSIKSELGSKASLLNAGKTTNFIYRVNGLTRENMDEVNSIETKNKLLDRITKIYEHGYLSYFDMENQTFKENLFLIDTAMDSMVADILLESFVNGENDCQNLIDIVSNKNPKKYANPKRLYTFKIKKLLCSIALGMMPSKEWDGHDEATGGYIIVTRTGNVVAYHIYNRDFFETYLLEHTKLDRGSSSRHHYGSIYEANGEMFIKLNLQIRFKKPNEK